MKSKLAYLFPFVLVVFIAFSCSQSSRHEIKIIQTKGVPVMLDLTKSSTNYGSMWLEDSTSGIALQDGDLLDAVYEKDRYEFVFQYSPGLGKKLDFEWDSLKPFKVSLNNQDFSATLKDSASWLWIKNKSRETFSGLHSISLSLPLTDNQMTILSGLAKDKPNLNLCIDGISEIKQSEKILSMFHPEWLYFIIGDSVTVSDSLLHEFGKINSLYVSVGYQTKVNINQLSQLPNLKNMILAGYPEEGSSLNFKDFIKLSALSLNVSSLKSSRSIILPDNIGSLFFMHCDHLTDISNLASYTKLHTVGFSGCIKLKDISAIKGMKNLTWLSCPPSVDQAQLDSLIPSLPSLQVLELINCDSLRNIDVVKKVKGLRSLTLAATHIDISSLYTMKNLELLVIEIRSKSDSAYNKQMHLLKAQLPNTLVVPGGGFCLGSGWILLIIPMVLLGTFIFRRMRHTPNELDS